MLTDAAKENLELYMQMGENAIANQLDDRHVSKYTRMPGDPDETEAFLVALFVDSCERTGRLMQEVISWLRDRQDNRPVGPIRRRNRGRVARRGKPRIP